MLKLMLLWVFKFVDSSLILYIMEMYITRWKVLLTLVQIAQVLYTIAQIRKDGKLPY